VITGACENEGMLQVGLGLKAGVIQPSAQFLPTKSSWFFLPPSRIMQTCDGLLP